MNDVPSPPEGNLLERTIRNLRQAWRDIVAPALGGGTGAPHPDLSTGDMAALRRQMRACLEAKGGEVSARARAAALGRTYLDLSPLGRKRFLTMLAGEFDADRATVDKSIEALKASKDDTAREAASAALRRALEPPRLRLLTQFNGLPEGVKFLVDLRADLMDLLETDPELAGLEGDLKGLLASWFDVGFLELRRITWDSPAALLEKLIAYEAVHEIQSWDDLKNRLEHDRRLFAFFHPRMPDEPLIFVEVALVNGIADNIQVLLRRDAPALDPKAADTAIFYSITNAQKGLAGISFGGFLIKRVADQLANEFKRVKTFSTLSPVPGFRRWIAREFDPAAKPGAKNGFAALLRKSERDALAELATPVKDGGELVKLLDRPDWPEVKGAVEALREPLIRLCARYLMVEKRADGRARDPVAHFHLSNGASLERINWLADMSPRGLEQSATLMVNYVYRLDAIEENHEAYAGAGSVAASSTVKALIRR
jgi:malonyl-CoA decarboxylase